MCTTWKFGLLLQPMLQTWECLECCCSLYWIHRCYYCIVHYPLMLICCLMESHHVGWVRVVVVVVLSDYLHAPLGRRFSTAPLPQYSTFTLSSPFPVAAMLDWPPRTDVCSSYKAILFLSLIKYIGHSQHNISWLRHVCYVQHHVVVDILPYHEHVDVSYLQCVGASR